MNEQDVQQLVMLLLDFSTEGFKAEWELKTLGEKHNNNSHANPVPG